MLQAMATDTEALRPVTTPSPPRLLKRGRSGHEDEAAAESRTKVARTAAPVTVLAPPGALARGRSLERGRSLKRDRSGDEDAEMVAAEPRAKVARAVGPAATLPPAFGVTHAPEDLQARKHDALNRAFARIGKAMAGQKKAHPVEDIFTETAPDVFRPFAAERLDPKNIDVKGFAKKFDEEYRGDLAGHDEIVSTASVRSLLAGAVKGLPAGSERPAKVAEMQGLLNTLSRVRVPTEWVGVSTGTEKDMQHPTSDWALFNRTGMGHYHHDLQRRAEAAAAAEAVIGGKEPWTAQDVVHAMLRASIGYTLNNMMAPVTASNVQDHLRIKDEAMTRGAALTREELKKLHVRVGGTQEAPDQAQGGTDETRPWPDRSHLRSSSPERRPRHLAPFTGNPRAAVKGPGAPPITAPHATIERLRAARKAEEKARKEAKKAKKAA